MPRRNIQPVSVAGIEFPAMLDETQTFTSDIPEYPVETGFVISDNITLQPMELPQAFGILLFKPPFQDLLFLFQMFPYMGMFF